MFQPEERHVCFCFYVFLKSNRLLFKSLIVSRSGQTTWRIRKLFRRLPLGKKRNTPYSSARLDTPHPHMEQLGGLGIPNTVLSMLCASWELYIASNILSLILLSSLLLLVIWLCLWKVIQYIASVTVLCAVFLTAPFVKYRYFMILSDFHLYFLFKERPLVDASFGWSISV